MKKFELCSMRGCPGNYTAVLYNRVGGYYEEKRFLFYSKKEIFYKLRNEYNCTIAKGRA